MAENVYFDTTIFLDAFEGVPNQASLLEPIFELAEKKPYRVVTSDLTLAELLGKETGKGWAWQTRFYEELIIRGNFIKLQGVSRQILLATGQHRRAARAVDRNVKLADAIHVVTAMMSQCQYVFTSDRRFFVPQPLTRITADANGINRVLNLLDA